MESFYDDSAPMGAPGTEYKKVIERLDEEARTNLVCIDKNKILRRMFLIKLIVILLGYCISFNCT
jgi:hypothetical protein